MLEPSQEPPLKRHHIQRRCNLGMKAVMTQMMRMSLKEVSAYISSCILGTHIFIEEQQTVVHKGRVAPKKKGKEGPEEEGKRGDKCKIGRCYIFFFL